MTPGTFNFYGLLMALAILVGTLLCVREERQRELAADTGLDVVLYAVPAALIGARLYYVVFAWHLFRDDPVSALYIWEGGLALYGGVIGGILGLILLSRKRRLPLWLLTDIAAPSLLLGQAIGRWGNYFNGEAHGGIVRSSALQFFPIAVNIDGMWFFATFFYESLWNLLGFAFLYLNRRKFREKDETGDLTLWYFLCYGSGRMLIEMVRTDSLMLSGVRVSQLLSILLFLAAGFLLGIRRRIPKALFALLAAGGTASIVAAAIENMPLLIGSVLVDLIFVAVVYAGYARVAE